MDARESSGNRTSQTTFLYVKASEGSERLVIVLKSVPKKSISTRIGSLRGFESGTAGNAKNVDCQTRAVYALSLLSLPLSDNRIISNDVGMVVNKENDDIGAIRPLAARAPPIPPRSFALRPHLHSFLPIPHLTTLTAVAGIHTALPAVDHG